METYQDLRVLYKKPTDCRFSIQINNLDYYQTAPTIFDRPLNTVSKPTHKLYNIPIIRIFGTTQHDQRILVHIHGVYPYLYVPYTGSLLSDDGMYNSLLTVRLFFFF